MTAYIIAEIEITDPDTYEIYRSQTPGVIEKHGGRFLVRGGEIEPLEGGWDPSRLVVIEFPDMAAARKFYESDAYQKIVGYRQKASKSRLLIVDGHKPAGWSPPL